MGVLLKSEEDIALMKEGGRMLAEIMQKTKEKATIGITTKSLDEYAQKLIKEKGGEPSFKGYRDFPAALCISVNDTIVHGLPSEYRLKEGDILSLDLGFLYKGFHTDMAITFPIGEVDGDKIRLIRETKKALKRGIKKTRVGNTIGDIGNTIERHAQKASFAVVQGLCGHGIGKEIHEEPQVLNEGKRGKGVPIEKGMVICIEPMFSAGSPQIERASDKMGIKTKDGSLSAHFEHTIAVTEKGTVVLTELS